MAKGRAKRSAALKGRFVTGARPKIKHRICLQTWPALGRDVDFQTRLALGREFTNFLVHFQVMSGVGLTSLTVDPEPFSEGQLGKQKINHGDHLCRRASVVSITFGSELPL